MKESRIYWQAKRELMAMMFKNKSSADPSLQDLYKALLLTGGEEKLGGLINNCLQKSTRRLPV
jgi:hypothetical protein